MGKLMGAVTLIVIAALAVMAAVSAVAGGDDDPVHTVVQERPRGDRDGKRDDAEPVAPGTAVGERIVWTGPLVEDYGLTGEQMDATFERIRECLSIEKATYLELCMQGREGEYFDEGGLRDRDPAGAGE